MNKSNVTPHPNAWGLDPFAGASTTGSGADVPTPQVSESRGSYDSDLPF